MIPAALILLAAGLLITLRAKRTDVARASYLMWGGYLIVTGAVFSFAQGIIHPYYSIALAPPIGALIGIGAVELWKRRGAWPARLTISAALIATSAWGYVLLDRSPEWNPWLKVAIVAAGLAAAALIAAVPLVSRPLAIAVASVALLAALAGPAAYTLDTVTTAHAGAIPSAGPTRAMNGLGGFGQRVPPGGFQASPQGAFHAPSQGGFQSPPQQGAFNNSRPGGNFLQASQPSAELTATLEANAGSYRWVAATIDANSAASYELATGDAVMAIGGFNGSDPAPTLAEFQSYVSQGQIHYFIAGGMRGGNGNGAAIETWVSQHFTATTVGNVTIYDLTKPAS